MKRFKSLVSLVIMLVFMASFSQCSSSKNLDDQAPTSFGKVYAQRWTAGVKGGGSGLSIYIPVNDASVILDSVYFRGRASLLETKPSSPNLFIGRFALDSNPPEDLIISSDPKDEINNKLPVKAEKIPFELKDDECVVSYKKNNETHYFKIDKVETKKPLNYPTAPPNRQ